jgi:hypothetical protein
MEAVSVLVVDCDNTRDVVSAGSLAIELIVEDVSIETRLVLLEKVARGDGGSSLDDGCHVSVDIFAVDMV